MPKTTIKDLERQLDLLKRHLGDHDAKADRILDELKNLQPGEFDIYSEAFGTGLRPM